MKKVAIISDIHGNFPALKAVLTDIETERADRIICLGDLVGYYCMINEVIDIIRELEIETILGNHDYAMAYDPAFIARSRTCVKVQARQMQYIKPENISYLRTLKQSIRFEYCGKSFFCVHGGLEDYVDQYLYEIDEGYFRKNNFQADVLVTGHTHLPVNVPVGDHFFLNPGSVGQPRDSDNRASYLLLSHEGFHHKRVQYDIDRIASEMKDMGFDEYIYEILYRGVNIGQ